MGLKLDWRGFMMAACANGMAPSFFELPAVLVQRSVAPILWIRSINRACWLLLGAPSLETAAGDLSSEVRIVRHLKGPMML